jgi:hypothetical protein
MTRLQPENKPKIHDNPRVSAQQAALAQGYPDLRPALGGQPVSLRPRGLAISQSVSHLANLQKIARCCALKLFHQTVYWAIQVDSIN